MNVNASNYWNNIYKLLSDGETAKAIELCETEPYSELLECQRYLGWTYYAQGEMGKALNWFTKAADKGDGEALFGIGSIHVAQKEFQIALQHFEQAVDHGYARGYQWMAGIYQHGCGMPADINKAISYYKQGAALGYIMAERSLINIAYRQGNIWVKIYSVPKLILLQVKTAKIAYRNLNDPRLADVQKSSVRGFV